MKVNNAYRAVSQNGHCQQASDKASLAPSELFFGEFQKKVLSLKEKKNVLVS
jgi:hypothetical protein